MKRILSVLLWGGLWPGAAPAQPAQPTYQLRYGTHPVAAKNYYLLTLCGELPAVRRLLTADSALARLTRQKLAQLRTAPTDCKADPFCYTDRMKFSDADVRTVRDRLAVLYAPNNALGRLVTDHLLPSGTYHLYRNLPPKDVLLSAWEQDAAGVNYAIGVYGEGKKPNYPAIDSISYAVNDRRYGALLTTVAETLAAELKGATLFAEPSLTAALRFLEINGRQQAADFEPMAETVNRATLAKIRTLNWRQYPYTLILVLGAGPADYATALSGEAMLRLRMAATRYREGLAPLLVVSGGRVHPYKTRYCEAEEMKRYLVETLHVPADAILMDPHARHTTTNLRNTVRLMYRYGLPLDKPGVVSSASSHIQLVLSDAFAGRCTRELRFIPFRKGNRLTPTEAEFYPVPDALQINPTEPLDP